MRNLRFILFIVLASLSSGCINDIVKPSSVNQNLQDFEAAWNRIDAIYPFLEYKKIDWDSIYTKNYPRAEAAQGDEFYSVLSDLLAELKDGHVYYETEGGARISPYTCPRALKDKKRYNPLVVRKYFGGELLLTDHKVFEYGILPDDIGYFYLPGFSDSENFSFDYSIVIDYMKSTKGLIIDLRNNGGGSSLNVQRLVANLTIDSINFPPLFLLGEEQQQTTVQPSQLHNYNHKVVVLINGMSMSAAELTVEVLKQLPNVTAVGDTTAGALGSKLDRNDSSNSIYQLPSGKSICTPVGYYLGYDGEQIEWNGVVPDVLIEQTEEDILEGKDKQLEYAIGLLKK